MSKFLDQLLKFGQRRHFLISIVWMALFLGFILPYMQKQHEHFAGEAGVPDMQFQYQAEDLYRMADAYGEEGRREYVNSRLTFDLVFPIAYTYFNVSLLAFALNRGLLGGRRMKILLLVPIFGLIFDLLENSGVSLVLIAWPEQYAWMAGMAVYGTMLKWIFVVPAFGLALLALISILLRKKW